MRTVYMAGYILKASTNLPSKISNSALCAPQPKHSMPKRYLLIQGIK